MIDSLEITSVRSDGNIFSYENEDWGIVDTEGLDFCEMEIFTRAKGFGHGDIITGKRKLSREIKIVTRLKNTRNYSMTQPRVLGYHNGNYTYDLHITHEGRSMIAKNCELKVASYPYQKDFKTPELTLLFISPEPDLYADNEDKVSFVSTVPLWHDTRYYIPTKSLAFGELTKATSKVINYLGSEKTPITITISATGLVNGINVRLNGKTSNIKTELLKDDVLVIDAGERIVTKNSKLIPLRDYNAAELMELMLEYGDNVIEVNSDSTAYTAEVNFTGRYGGI